MKGTGGARGVKRLGAASAFERTGGALGFEAFRSVDEFSTPMYVGGEESLRAPFKALLTKRDATTKVKAIADLEDSFRTLDVEICREALPHWAFLYERCQKDNDRRVRLGAARIMNLLVSKLPKAVGERRFEHFASDWLCSCFDPENECARIAKEALDQVKEDKFPESVLRKLCKFARQRSPDETFDNFGGSIEEESERSFRVRAQALKALVYYLNKVDLDSLNLDDFTESSSWHKFIVANDAEGGPFVRRAAYELVAFMAAKKSFESILLEQNSLKLLLRIPSEKSRIATPAMWSALTDLCQNFDLLNRTSVEALRKGFFPEMFRHLERRANDAGFKALQNCLVLLSLIPDAVWRSYGAAEFCDEWFGHLLNEENLSDADCLAAALECANYLLKKKDLVIQNQNAVARIMYYVDSALHRVLSSPNLVEKQDLISSLSILLLGPCSELSLESVCNNSPIEVVIQFLTSAAETNISKRDRALFIAKFSASIYSTFERGFTAGSSELILMKLLDVSSLQLEEWVMLMGRIDYDKYPRLVARIVGIFPALVSDIILSAHRTNPLSQKTLLALVSEMATRSVSEENILSLVSLIDESTFEELQDDSLVSRFGSQRAKTKKSQQVIDQLDELFSDPLRFSLGCAHGTITRKSLEDVSRSVRMYRVDADPLHAFLLDGFLGSHQVAQGELKERILHWLLSCGSFGNSTEWRELWSQLVLGLDDDLSSIPSLPHPSLVLALMQQEKGFSLLARMKEPRELVWWMLCRLPEDSISCLQFKGDLKSASGPSMLPLTRVDVLSYLFSSPVEASEQPNPQKALLMLLDGFETLDTNQALEWCESALSSRQPTFFMTSDFTRLVVQKLAAVRNDIEPLKAFLERQFISAAQLFATHISLAVEDEIGEESLSSAPDAQRSLETSQASSQGENTANALKVGDNVMYTKSDGQSFKATVVARHEEGRTEDSYYTIRYWHEDRSRETQTTRDRLKILASPSAEISDEERHRRLIEVQRQMQIARQKGDRAESAKLMRLQQELMPKPKDTDEERQHMEKARLKAEREWKEKRKQAERALAGAGPDIVDADENDEDSRSKFVVLRREWSSELSSTLNLIASFAWRKDDKLFPLGKSEQSALMEANSRARWASMTTPLPSSDRDLSALVSLIAMNPPETMDASRFISCVVVALARSSPTRPMSKELRLITNRCGKLISEQAAGQVLKEWTLLGDTNLKVQWAEIVVTLRFKARSVWSVASHLYDNMMSSPAVALASFTLLYRHPEPLAPSEQNSDTEDDRNAMVTYARSLFPPILVGQVENDWTGQNSLGCFAAWLMLLRYVVLAWKTSSIGAKAREAIGLWLRQNEMIYRVLDVISLELFISDETSPVLIGKERTLIEGKEDDDGNDAAFAHMLLLSLRDTAKDEDISQRMASRSFYQTVHVMPALVRDWWADHLTNRFERESVSKFTATLITPNVLRQDLSELNDAVQSGAWDRSELTIRPSLAMRKVVICTMKDDTSLEVEVTFSDNYPLQPAQVECTKQIGIKQERWKRWALQIVMLLNKRDGTLSDAVQMWKQNLDKEFEGVEPCPICYSVLHAVDSSLPKLQCKTCKNTFHGKCLSQWFASSHQSLCPLCKQSFLAN